MKLTELTLCAALCGVAAGCSSPKPAVESTAVAAAITPGAPVNALPKAIVYKMSGDASALNVPVTVSPETGEITSFPGPSDVVGQEPIALGDGWLLDQRGISENSRFTRWTYAEYQALKRPPTLSELKAAIIPGARAVDLRRLPMTPWDAAADTAAVKKILGED